MATSTHKTTAPPPSPNPHLATLRPFLSNLPAPTPASTSAGEAFRSKCRSNSFTGPTSGLCPSHLQANLLSLPREHANDFLLFCALNPRPLPLLDVVYGPILHPGPLVGSPTDLSTDLPSYDVYPGGSSPPFTTPTASPHWPPDSVTFLLGCSFTFERSLTLAGLPPRNTLESHNVSMYRTNLLCRPAGVFKDVNVVVSMRPYKAHEIPSVIAVTSRHPNAHGAPIHHGPASLLGIADVLSPDYGDPTRMEDDDVCVFWACGVTGTEAVREAGVAAVCHSPGTMLVTDVVEG